MLISFRVENFRSISAQQEITFVASRHQNLSEAVVRNEYTETGLVPVVAIFGANGAGKTNFLAAMEFVHDAIVHSQNGWKPSSSIEIEPHFFNRDKPTTFECQFALKSDVFRFGFTLDSKKIIREWLFENKKLLYRRNESAYRFGLGFRGFSHLKSFTRPNSLFLSCAAQNNQPSALKIYKWFSDWDEITDSRFAERTLTARLLEDPDAKVFLQKAISVIDPHIIGIEPAGNETPDLPFEAEQKFKDFLKDYHKWSGISFVHQSRNGEVVRLNLNRESKGTQDYFSIIGSITIKLNGGGLMLLDEAGASLHPMLLRAIVMLFQSPKTNPHNAQLVFSTHDVTLLNPEILRPDEVWFAERHDEGSAFFSLADFEGIRSDLRAEKAYLEGRFGAVPFIEDHLDIFAEELNKVFGRIK